MKNIFKLTTVTVLSALLISLITIAFNMATPGEIGSGVQDSTMLVEENNIKEITPKAPELDIDIETPVKSSQPTIQPVKSTPVVEVIETVEPALVEVVEQTETLIIADTELNFDFHPDFQKTTDTNELVNTCLMMSTCENWETAIESEMANDSDDFELLEEWTNHNQDSTIY